MASATLPKPSFAKVAAASPVKRQTPGTSNPSTMKPEASSSAAATADTMPTKDASAISTPDDANLANAVAQLAISAPSGQHIESSVTSPKARSAGDSDGSHRTTSSEIGTKPPSLDGKSVTSGTTTTFAMDEKDSLRPDDSASVQAATDDDDASIRGSLVVPAAELQASIARGAIVNSQAGSVSEQPMGTSDVTSDALGNIYQQAPDEKLLEAISSVKDCQFLLRLEVDVISFVQESKEPYMDLPPSNSFFRMLTHKLADYYHMTHSYEKDNGPGFVRIFRTPFCRVPPSLASIAESKKSPDPPPPMIPMKIMRRGEDGEAAMSSASQSKAASEVGSEQKEKPVVKETRKTREEREEAYNEARKRIFGSSNTTSVSNGPDGSSENGVSRASSVSAKEKEKSTVSTRRPKNTKQRRNSNGFESRHNYVPQWNTPQAWGNQPPQYVPIGSVYQGPPSGYPGQVSGHYPNGAHMNGPGPQGPGYHPQAYGPNGSYPQHAPAGRYPPNGPPMATYGPSGVPSGQAPQWQHNPNYRPQYGRGGPPPNMIVGPNGVPYAYGQLPNNINPYDVKSQHPIPGSYNRNGFNPKTQSFIPTTGVQAPAQPMYPGGSPHHVSPRMDSYTPYIPSPQMAAAQPYAPGYGMPPPPMGVPAQMPPYMAQQQHHYPHQPMQQHGSHGHHSKTQSQKSNNGSNSSAQGKSKAGTDANKSPKPAASQNAPAAQPYGNLPHYGNPATLPQKPT